MMWIITIIVVAVVYVFIRFLMDFIKQRGNIASQGGIKTIYGPLIDGLLQYPSARIIQDQKDFVTVGGTFIDPILNRDCGWWSISIQPVFKTLNVQYKAHNDLEGGENAKQIWDFPINMSQEEMLAIIKKKADEWEAYGIFK